MTHRKIASIVILFLLAAPLFAQRIATGVKHVKKPADTGTYTIVFDPTPVGQTTTQDCYYNCFYLTNVDQCDYSGTITLLQSATAPFRTINLRKSTITAPDCNGTPVSLPVTLNSGEVLLQDFTFSPTAPGSFQGSETYNLTPTNSPNQVFSWILQGTTGGAPSVVSFAAVPSSITPNQQTTLTWVTSGATTVSIDNGVGPVGASGSVTVSPSSTTTYTLTATNSVSSSAATATVTVINTPSLAISALPRPILQLANTGGTSTSFTVTNNGGGSTNVTLSKTGPNFFTLSPTSFTLGAGASQAVTVTATAEAAGAFEGTANVSGSGVTGQLQVAIKLLSTSPPNGTVKAQPATNRVDTSQSTSGTVSFTNSGNAALSGVLVSDVPWIVPQSGIVTIPPGGTETFTFTIDRTKRIDSGIGSATGSISLIYLSGAAGKTGALDATQPPSVTTVAVVDTPPLTVGSAAPPPLSPGEVALFVPGVGHVAGSVGTFISDLSVLNPPGNPQVSDIRFYYSGPSGTQKSTSLPSVSNVSVSLADVVKNVFATDSQVGSLQVRSASAAKLSVSTNIFNSSNPAGTYGTSIPTFRSDRGVGAGDRLVITGIRQDSGAHTNLFIQETAGIGVTVQSEFLDQNGTTLGTRSDSAAAFALTTIPAGSIPTGTVVAIMTNTSTGNGTFLAYGTPVDNASGDDWAIADWSRVYNYSGGDPVIIPVAGVAPGANNSLFRTDVTITNTGTATGSGTLKYFPRGGTASTRTITLGGRQSMILNDVVGNFFAAPPGVGYLSFTPSSGTFAIANRTYTGSTSSAGTYGSATPVLPANGSLTLGALRAIGSLQDATATTIGAATPATFRTNFGIVETSGNPATVRVTLRFSYPSGQKLQASGSAFKDYPLGANEFKQLNNVASEILGAGRATLGDLRDLEVDFQVVSGTGAVAVYTSSIDNGTNDSILRTE